MNPKFDVVFLSEALEFIKSIDDKSREKIIYNIDKSRFINDPKLLKKLTDDIWEFRTLYGKRQYRLLAFWDESSSKKKLVLTTHGFVKKTKKIPGNELNKAKQIRIEYFRKKAGGKNGNIRSSKR